MRSVFSVVAVLTIATVPLIDAAHAQTPAPAPAPAPAQVFPPDFRGQVTYAGNYRAQTFKAAPPPRGGAVQVGPRGVQLNLPGILGPSGTSKEIAGQLSVVLEFSGNEVKGLYRATGGFGGETITGTRNGDQCRFDDHNSEFNGHCGPDGLAGNWSTFQGQNPSVQSSLALATTKVIDHAEQEQKQVAARVEQQRKQKEALDRVAAMTGDQKKLELLLEQDSNGWMMNRYDIGSMTDVHVEKSASGQTIDGNFTVNGGSPRSVKARYAQGALSCVEMSDFPGKCRPLGQSPSQGVALGVVGGMMSDSMNGGGGGSNCDSNCQSSQETARYQAWQQRENQDFQTYRK